MENIPRYYFLGGLLAILSLPLIFNLIGPNQFYGIRTRSTLSDRALWFTVNRFGGIAILIAAVVGVFLAKFVSENNVPIRPELATLIPIIFSLIAIAYYHYRLTRSPN